MVLWSLPPFNTKHEKLDKVTSTYLILERKNRMPNCICCKSYFKNSLFNQTAMCLDCSAVSDIEDDSDLQLEIDKLVNRTNKTKPVFYDDRLDDTDSFSI